MKYLLFTMLLSLGCSAGDGKTKNDSGTQDVPDTGPQDVPNLGDDVKMGLDIPDCFFLSARSGSDDETPPLSIKPFILTGKNTEKEVSFTMVLCQYKHDFGETMLHRLDYFSVTWKGIEYNIATKNIKYNNTKHSWFDSLEARTPEADFDWSATFRSDIDVLPQFTHKLSGKVGTNVLEETIMDVQCDNCRNGEFVFKE